MIRCCTGSYRDPVRIFTGVGSNDDGDSWKAFLGGTDVLRAIRPARAARADAERRVGEADAGEACRARGAANREGRADGRRLGGGRARCVVASPHFLFMTSRPLCYLHHWRRPCIAQQCRPRSRSQKLAPPHYFKNFVKPSSNSKSWHSGHIHPIARKTRFSSRI